jgi:hypothetical protein
MYIKKIGFDIISDNDEQYFSLLRGVIESIDCYSHLEISKNPKSISFRLSPSSSIYTDVLIKDINSLNNMLNIRVNFSKSIKSTSIISFSIEN